MSPEIAAYRLGSEIRLYHTKYDRPHVKVFLDAEVKSDTCLDFGKGFDLKVLFEIDMRRTQSPMF